MRANQTITDVSIEQSRAHVRKAPRCYSRQAPANRMDEVRWAESVLALCSVMSCAVAAFLVVRGGWGL